MTLRAQSGDINGIVPRGRWSATASQDAEEAFDRTREAIGICLI